MPPEDRKGPPPSRAFVSYSWSSPTHQSWVINLATRLREDGVDVVLDKWDLLPGHDSIKFMEQMVTDPNVTKVIMVCDRTYAEKADGRAGGVGTESQIISPKIYGNASQNKFAAVITELDPEGNAYVPTFYKGRIYFDFSASERGEAAYEELLRWLVDKPLHVKPKLGSVPASISAGQTTTTVTSSRAKRVADAIRESKANAVGLLAEYFELLLEEFPSFVVDRDKFENFDDGVIEAVERFRPYAKQYQEVIVAVSRFGTDAGLIDTITTFLENAGRFMFRPEHVSSYNTHDFDQFKIILHDIFLATMAIFLKGDRFDLAVALTKKAYLIKGDSDRVSGQRATTSFKAFWNWPESLQNRNIRLKLNRISLHADLISGWYKGSALSLEDIMQADFVLYIISSSGGETTQWERWYPTTLVFATRKFSPFEIFARAESKAYFERIKTLFGTPSAEIFRDLLGVLSTGQNRLRFDYFDLPIQRLANADQLASVP